MIKSILCVLGFYIAYGIAKSIFNSFLDDNTTLEFAYRGEWMIAGGIATGICTIFGTDENKEAISSGILVVLTVLAMFLPFSWGIVILYNLTVIGCIGNTTYDG